eukprot:TRINITY_DN498_c0_g1_i2.p1 TRINITY_DN498_c0_g1~~TRINITY_DN498_c0_g1_i2.p1  ORF type:complete len:333 (+),score=59.19 TRINITY_DN498_c0_g1_i2:874-1872(+)
MKNALLPWLQGTNPNSLKYDTVWGGVCSTEGLKDITADFGQGYYNDHHFHYGYHLYAYAVIAREDPGWVFSHFNAILDLVRDIANPSPEDTYFTPFRHMDWFHGHSWGSGLFVFTDSNNQESTSEAVNAWYSVYLLGVALGDNNLKHVGQVLLATEIRSTHKYYHIPSTSTVYDPIFAQNKIVGILWETKVDYATWFGLNVEYIHCIQMLPFTPITEVLLPASYVKEEYPILAPALNGNIQEGWKGFVHMDHAIINKDQAWVEVQRLRSYDEGNSATNTYWWVATRPRFNMDNSTKDTFPKDNQCFFFKWFSAVTLVTFASTFFYHLCKRFY